MSNKLKEMVFFIGFFILAITIPIAVYLANQNEPLKYQSRADSTNKMQLYFWPAILDLPVCSDENVCPKTKIEVILNTKGKNAGGVDLYLRYDPNLISIYKNAIAPGMVDENYNQMGKPFDYYRDGYVDEKNGLITLKALGNYNGERGVVATLFASGKQAGKGSLEIVSGEKGTKVWDEKGIRNLLGAVSSAEITVK